MKIAPLGLAAHGGFTVYFIFGRFSLAVSSLKNECLKYPAVYRSAGGIKGSSRR